MSPSKTSDLDWSSFYNIINGDQCSSSETYNGINPATGDKLWTVPVATEQDVNTAVEAARNAFRSWRTVSVNDRRSALLAWSEKLRSYKDELTDILCKEVGRPRPFSAMEVDIVADTIDTLAALDLPVERIEDETKVLTTRYVPLGVVGAICPWNFPLILSLSKVASALITGCVIIVKPSPFTPYSALKCVEAAQAFFPAGVVQILGGNDKLGPMLTAHAGVDKIAFTGSTATGKKIMEACCE